MKRMKANRRVILGGENMITKEKFKRFVNVQASGVCNMWSADVEQLAQLTEEEHLEIIKHYKVYEDMYDVYVEDFEK